MSGEPRAFIAHPSPLVRSSLGAALMARDIPVVGFADRIAGLERHCLEVAAQVVVAAERFPDGDLLSALAPVLTTGARVLAILDQHREDVVDVLLAGASGCVFLADSTPDEVGHAVRIVWKGASVLHPLAAQAVLSRWRAERAGASVPTRATGLTGREREILAAMADGRSTRGIAEELEISVKTVEAHKARVFAKLGARNQAHAVSIAKSRHLLC